MEENKLDLADQVNKLDQLLALFNNLNLLAKLQTQKLIDFDQKLNKLIKCFDNTNITTQNKKEEVIDFTEAIIPTSKIEIKNNETSVEQLSQKQDEKKVIVQQKLFFQKTKTSIVAANIVAIDSQNKRLTTRSSPNGRWRLGLTPGEYIIEISRPPMKDEPPIQSISFPISIKDTFKPIELGDKYI